MTKFEEITRTIIDRSKGIVDDIKAKKAYKASGIEIDLNGKISINKPGEETLNCLVKNLIIEGGVIAKIMLHNLSLEKGFKIY